MRKPPKRTRRGVSGGVLVLFCALALGMGRASTAAGLQISEVVASNTDGLRDEDGDAEDWIELHNVGAVPVDLGGLMLDDGGVAWSFGGGRVEAGGRVLVFASGKDRSPLDGQHHASFSLSSSGEALTLRGIDGAIIDRLEFPALRDGISFGLQRSDGVPAVFRVPSPGEPNPEVGLLGILEPPGFSTGRGYYSSPFGLTLDGGEGAEVRFTIDGSEPDALTGRVYNEPLTIRESTVVRALSVRAGWLESVPVAHTFLFTGDVLQQPEMSREVVEDPAYSGTLGADLLSLPTLSISVSDAAFFGAEGIYKTVVGRGRESEVPIAIEFFDPAGEAGEFATQAGLRIHGGQARFHKKKPLRVYFRGEYGDPTLEFPLFAGSPVAEFKRLLLRPGGHDGFAIEWNVFQGGQPAVDENGDFVLSGRNDLTETASYTRDEFIRRTETEIGLLSPRGRFVQLYINGRYWGMYNLHERADTEFLSSHGGGDPEDWDLVGQNGIVEDGDGEAWETLQERSAAGVFSDADFASLEEFIEMDSFIDSLVTPDVQRRPRLARAAADQPQGGGRRVSQRLIPQQPQLVYRTPFAGHGRSRRVPVLQLGRGDLDGQRPVSQLREPQPGLQLHADRRAELAGHSLPGAAAVPRVPAEVRGPSAEAPPGKGGARARAG